MLASNFTGCLCSVKNGRMLLEYLNIEIWKTLHGGMYEKHQGRETNEVVLIFFNVIALHFLCGKKGLSNFYASNIHIYMCVCVCVCIYIYIFFETLKYKLRNVFSGLHLNVTSVNLLHIKECSLKSASCCNRDLLSRFLCISPLVSHF